MNQDQAFIFNKLQRYSPRELRLEFGLVIPKGDIMRLYTLEEAREIGSKRQQKVSSGHQRSVVIKNPCGSCSLHHKKMVKSSGDISTARVVFIGQHPWAEEETQGKPFVGESGLLLKEIFKDIGIDLDDCYLGNVCRCRPSGDAKLTAEQIKNCMGYLRAELASYKGLIVLLGAVPLQAFLGKTSIRNTRGFGFEKDDRCYFVTRNPASPLKSGNDKEKEIDNLRQDLQAVAVYLNNDFSLDYEMLDNVVAVEGFVNNLAAIYQGPLTFDIETTGLDPFAKDARVLSIAFSYGQADTYFIPLPIGKDKDIINILKPIFSNQNLQLVGQSGKFDLNWLRVHYDLECFNYWFDTTLAHFLLEGKYAPSKLKEMAWKYTDYGGYDDVDVSKLAEASIEDLGQYNSMDAFVTFELMKIFKEKLTDKQLQLLTEIMCPSISAFSEMEMGGLKIDYANLEEFSDKCRNQLGELEQKMHGYPAVIELEEAKGDVLNFNSSDQLVQVLKKIEAVPKILTKKRQQISTTEKALKTIRPRPPFVVDLLKYKKQSKLYSTYLLPYLKDGNWWSEDGLAHGDYDFDRTNTGRTACRAPNLQNIPYPMRPIFVSKYGWFVEADYSQLELRVLASLANDPVLIADFKNGVDAHEGTRLWMFGDNSELSDVKKTEQRKKAKGVNFSVTYGTTKYGLADSLKISQEKAQAWIDAYYDLHPAIKQYQDTMIKFAKDHEYIETPFGRKRYFNFKRAGLSDKDIEAMHREIKNTLPQSTASDVVVLSAGKVWQMMRAANMQSRLAAYIHDNIMVDMVEQEVEEFIPQLKVIMEGLEFAWLRVPLVVDIKVGTHWGRMEKLDL